jgi:hypothetical protein
MVLGRHGNGVREQRLRCQTLAAGACFGASGKLGRSLTGVELGLKWPGVRCPRECRGADIGGISSERRRWCRGTRAGGVAVGLGLEGLRW